ncbi:hypothetical protein B0H12DRAFT_1323184 [Mycena haematopus]|nr:hypothetical protein B0H12DRAFT_1323184 [Mycena haematopus]
MTITRSESAPLVAVVGATGIQGGSVIKALSESDKPYRIRGFTRDPTKPAAETLKKKGVEMVAVDLVLENKEEVFKAFTGADYAFLVTNFWEHMNVQRYVGRIPLERFWLQPGFWSLIVVIKLRFEAECVGIHVPNHDEHRMRWELTAFHFFFARLLFTLTGLNFPPQQPLVFLLQLLLPPAETFDDDVFGPRDLTDEQPTKGNRGRGNSDVMFLIGNILQAAFTAGLETIEGFVIS